MDDEVCPPTGSGTATQTKTSVSEIVTIHHFYTHNMGQGQSGFYQLVSFEDFAGFWETHVLPEAKSAMATAAADTAEAAPMHFVSVGCGQARYERRFFHNRHPQLKPYLRLVDPEPCSFDDKAPEVAEDEPELPVLMKAAFATVADYKAHAASRSGEVRSRVCLVLVKPPPDGLERIAAKKASKVLPRPYDVEAIEMLEPDLIFLAYEVYGGDGSSELHHFLFHIPGAPSSIQYEPAPMRSAKTAEPHPLSAKYACVETSTVKQGLDSDEDPLHFQAKMYAMVLLKKKSKASEK